MRTKIVKIKKISNLGNSPTVCDVTVADNHNLFISSKISEPSILVHNCASDTQLLYWLHDCQLERAKNTLHTENGKEHSYYKTFLKLIIYQYSNNVHDYGEMEHAGSFCDVKHLLYLQSEESLISKQVKDSILAIYKTKAAQKANTILLKEKGVNPDSSVFKAPFVFKINDNKHKELLFFDVLKLKPVEYSKKTGKPGLGKKFKDFYKDHPVVKLFIALEEAQKIKSTYVTAFIKALSRRDGKDGFLRAAFGFFDVLTGRANSSKPSFQQIPEHKSLAKLIKRIFATPKGQLIIKLDYSAHEVRCWSFASGDTVLGNVFRIGRDLKQKLYQTGKLKYLKSIFYNGDVHKLNASYFFSVLIEAVDSVMRQATKGVVFGCIYGQSESTLAKKINRTVEFVKNLYKNFFKRFPQAAAWLTWTVKFSEKNLFTYAPTGRRRHLMGYLVPLDSVQAAMRRRAQNAPIQGFGSDIVHTAARLFKQHVFEYFMRINEIDENTPQMRTRLNRMVHDSIFTSADFHVLLAVAQILQWCCIKGAEEFYDEKFGIKFTVPLEIEMEFGASTDKTYKWDWNVSKFNEKDYKENLACSAKVDKKALSKFLVSFFGKEVELDEKNLKKVKADKKAYAELEKIQAGEVHLESWPLDYCIRESCKDYVSIYGGDAKAIEKEIFNSWNDSKVKKYLDKNYPILP